MGDILGGSTDNIAGGARSASSERCSRDVGTQMSPAASASASAK